MNKKLPVKKKVVAALVIIVGVSLLFLFLRPVFRGTLILPQLFHLGPLTVHYYGLIMALAIVAAYGLATWRAKIYGFTTEQLDRLVIVLIVSGFVGARLYHVASDFGFYLQHPAQIVAVWQGGLGIFGAIIGGAAGLVFARRWWLKHISILALLDWLIPSLLLGQIIGRFGNLFNYELFGHPTALAWKMFVPIQFRPEAFLYFNYFHPLFLYEALINVLILLVLVGFLANAKRWSATGSLFFAYLFLYNAGRFFLEMYRTDTAVINMTWLNNVTMGVLVIVGLVGLIKLNHAKTLSSHN